jgi:Uma2 family endonuclease
MRWADGGRVHPTPPPVLPWDGMAPGTAEKRTPMMGPYRAEDIHPGEPYELSDGHKITCMGTGQRGSRSNGSGFMVLDSDPDAPPAGVDAGISPVPSMLRAPDVAVGGLENEPGWATTAPPLAVEYADRGQDEPELQKKILELQRFGTRFVWVVRLTGPRRVEVYEPGKDVSTVHPGGALAAPGILKNAVPIEALYDRDAAHRQTLRNLLQREGYESLEAVKAEGRGEGVDAGRLVEARSALRRVLARRKLELSAEDSARIDTSTDLAALERWLDQAIDAASAAEALR